MCNCSLAGTAVVSPDTARHEAHLGFFFGDEADLGVFGQTGCRHTTDIMPATEVSPKRVIVARWFDKTALDQRE